MTFSQDRDEGRTKERMPCKRSAKQCRFRDAKPKAT
jgi:hypothetical protein